MTPVVFISYSHKDEKLKEQLLQQLGVLESWGLVETWSDSQIGPGREWRIEIREAIMQADLAILLITAEFLGSRFIKENEVSQLLKLSEEAGLILYPIIGLPCAWQEVDWLNKIQVRPKGGTPVWEKPKNAARYLAEVTREIADLLRNTSHASGPAKAAIKELETKFEQSVSSTKALDRGEIESRINLAIKHGIPVYNGGDAQGCARIYFTTARRLLTELRGELNALEMTNGPMMQGEPSMMKLDKMKMPMSASSTQTPISLEDKIILAAIRYDLRCSLEYAQSTLDVDPDRTAWDLRHCFNRILLLSEYFRAIESRMAILARTSRTERQSRLRDVIVEANQLGTTIYNQFYKQVTPDARSIHMSAALYLVTARKLMGLLSYDYQQGPKTLRHEQLVALRMLDQTVQENEIVEEDNTHRIAWNVRFALEKYLSK